MSMGHETGQQQSGTNFPGAEKLYSAFEQLLQAEKAYCQQTGSAILPTQVLGQFGQIRQKVYAGDNNNGIWSKQLVSGAISGTTTGGSQTPGRTSR